MGKYFGSVNALEDISLVVHAGEVTCVLGDNGAGKSTLIKILSGVFAPDAGELLIDGDPVAFSGPRAARAHGISTVFQDLATVPLMSIWRNFFLGSEPEKGVGPLRRLDISRAREVTRKELAKMGIDVRDPNQTVGEVLHSFETFGSRHFFACGTPEAVVEEIERWQDEVGIDGINLVQFHSYDTARDFAELVVPVLRDRGRLPQQPDPDASLRERIFGAGDRLPDNHYGARYRFGVGPGSEDPSTLVGKAA